MGMFYLSVEYRSDMALAPTLLPSTVDRWVDVMVGNLKLMFEARLWPWAQSAVLGVPSTPHTCSIMQCSKVEKHTAVIQDTHYTLTLNSWSISLVPGKRGRRV